MSMCHKAYALDHASFITDLAPILYDALASGHRDGLVEFIGSNLARLTLPWEAKPLPTDWRCVLEHGDVHEVGDLALTLYYDADDDCGLQEHWIAVEEGLPPAARASLLGEPFGPPDNLFDPGRMGSYFQSPSTVGESRDALHGRREPELQPFQALLEQVTRSGKGLYVTF
jgi:hypothetical protein